MRQLQGQIDKRLPIEEQRRLWVERNTLCWEFCIEYQGVGETWKVFESATRGIPAPRDLITATSILQAWQQTDRSRTYRLSARMATKWMPVVTWTNPRRECWHCKNSITVASDLTFVSHGRLIAVDVDSTGRKVRRSALCSGSGARIA